jgi:SAM-dependent methyltransferase
VTILYDPDQALREWTRIPIDDLDYFSAEELLILRPEQLREIAALAFTVRWDPNQWRNRGNSLIEFMSPLSWMGKTVMDFGCGLGLDSVVFLRNKANVILADMHPRNLALAQRVLVYETGHIPSRICVTSPVPPFFLTGGFDLFWSMGVLHHTPFCGEVLEQACSLLNPGGEIRACLYSDRRWKQMMECDPPEDTPGHPRFQEFVEKCDAVGAYADWYDEAKVEKLVEGFAGVTECKYLCDDQFIGVVLKPKGI